MIQEQTESLYLTSPSGEVFTHPFFLIATCFAVKPSPVAPEIPLEGGGSVEVWISPDAKRQHYSPYTYGSNNPVNRIDPDGNSDVVFTRSSGTIRVYSNTGVLLNTFPAGNNTTRSSNGPWANGTYNYGYHVDHPENVAAYGQNGNFVFNVPGRTGMGIHSGRRGPESRTLGCIRTTDEATAYLLELNESDPLNTISVQDVQPPPPPVATVSPPGLIDRLINTVGNFFSSDATSSTGEGN